MSALETARAAAAHHLRAGGFDGEAEMAASGRGDDFLEVRIALALHAIMSRPPAPARKTRAGHRLIGEEC
jgi:hypothetical protein